MTCVRARAAQCQQARVSGVCATRAARLLASARQPVPAACGMPPGLCPPCLGTALRAWTPWAG
eukprot:9741392-Alexandrium_andersonii.AAC.1